MITFHFTWSFMILLLWLLMFFIMLMAGKVCTNKQAVSHHRGDRSGLAIVRYDQGNIGYHNLCTPRSNCFRSRKTYGPVLHAIGSSENYALKSMGSFHERSHPPSMSLQSSKRCCSNIPKQRIRVKCESNLSSNPSCGTWSQFRVLNKLDIRNGLFNKSANVKFNRTCAHYKSEEYDITDAKVDSLPLMEGSGEAVLVEGNIQESSPWWQQFPKRWVIVLLCFASFLLCNMDRVSTFVFSISTVNTTFSAHVPAFVPLFQ